VFYFGRKALPGKSSVIPQLIQDKWEQDPDLQARFPNLFNLGTINNVMLWAKQKGRQQYSDIDAYFQRVVPFRKSATVSDDGQKIFDALTVEEPVFGTIPDPRRGDLSREQEHSEEVRQQAELLDVKNKHIIRLERHIKRIESGRVMRLMNVLGRKRK
jgi:hypothetical protein